MGAGDARGGGIPLHGCAGNRQDGLRAGPPSVDAQQVARAESLFLEATKVFELASQLEALQEVHEALQVCTSIWRS